MWCEMDSLKEDLAKSQEANEELKNEVFKLRVEFAESVQANEALSKLLKKAQQPVTDNPTEDEFYRKVGE